jgi:carboxyl-terminal processing protease
MKSLFYLKSLLITVFVLLQFARVSSQTKYQKIETFSKVWGFLKYHHPLVGTGKLDWDSVFIKNLPVIEQAKSKTEFNKIILTIINSLGVLEKVKLANIPDSLFKANHDLNWIGASKVLSSGLKSKLNEIYKYRNNGPNQYIKVASNTSADYSGEKLYEDIAFPDRAYRLLFLSRFWNAINYYAPYKYLIGEDWGNTLTRFIPQVINANDSVTYYKTLLKLAVALKDNHAQLWGAKNDSFTDLIFGKNSAPVYVDIVNDTVVVRKLVNDSLCKAANIKKGDIVLDIDGTPVVQKINELKLYISSSNNAGLYHNIARVLFNTHSGYQTLKIKRGSETFAANVKCILQVKKLYGGIDNYTANETGYKSVGNSIAYIYAMQIWAGNMDTIKALIKSKKAVIFDVRNYPNNGDIFYKIFDIFLPQPKVINCFTQIVPNNPGYFQWGKSGFIGGINNAPYTGNVIILADERSQSQGEYATMALQTIPNAVTIGSQTAGGDGVQTYMPMGGKLSLSYSGYGVYYPDKTITQRQGIKIDIKVKKTAKAIIIDDDETVDVALKYLKTKGIN